MLELYLYGNQLSTLPTKFGQRQQPLSVSARGNLINLEGINLYNNQLSSLPRAFALRGCFAVRLK